MNIKFRNSFDRTFTLIAYLSAVTLVIVLLVVLGPMILKGSQAIFFNGTVEFRKMQRELFQRADNDRLEAEIAKTNEYRQRLYQIIDNYESQLEGADTDKLKDEVKQAYRDYGDLLKAKGIQGQTYMQLRSRARDIRDLIEQAMESFDNVTAEQKLEKALEYSSRKDFAGTPIDKMAAVAEKYKKAIKTIDLSLRDTYQQHLNEVKEAIVKLLGPRPEEQTPHLAENKFGATRMDMAEKALDKIFYYEKWQPVPGKKSIKVLMQRRQLFAGTSMEKFFDYLRENNNNMLNPRKTFYWQYFIDDSTPGHYFGGVGPEILGTILITIVSMLIAIPLGIVSAAWLVEYSSDRLIFKIVRMCINTLAGVPSIVFGLFGMAFFVLFVLPVFGLESEPCILTAALTLAVLTLPVMIRASEEAIKAVPLTYREASLGLGAGKFKTFILVTLPAALPGILTGIILSLSRVAGETAPILFTGAVALGSVPKLIDPQSNLPTLQWLFQPTRTLSYGSYDMAVGDRIAMMVPHNQYGMVMTLIILILLLNGISIILRSRIAAGLRSN